MFSLLEVIYSSSYLILFIQHLFSVDTITQINTINVQCRFKEWYNQRFPHTCSLPISQDDSPLCTCSHRPMKNPSDSWSLQRAIAYTFHEFLDKSRTGSHWSYRLSRSNVHQYSKINNLVNQIHEHKIIYAVHDCLAVAKLMMVLELSWTREQLQQYNQL